MSGIAVGVDGSRPSDTALAWAVEEAVARRARLLVVRAFLPHGRRDCELGHSRAATERRVVDQLREVLAARGDLPTALAATTVVPGAAAPVLVELGQRMGQLVVGAAGKSGMTRMLLGSVSEACVHSAPCPVTVVRERGWASPAEPVEGDGVAPSVPPESGSDGSTNHGVVVGVDGSDPSRRALSFAVAAALSRRLPLCVVVAWQNEPLAARRVARLVADELTGCGVRPTVEPVAAEGPPAQVLLGHAAGAQRLVVGRRGLGAVRRLVMGSVSAQVARVSACPVTVVP